MNISKEFQEWANVIAGEDKYNRDYRYNLLMSAYKALNTTPSWLFPDMGSTEEVLREWEVNYGMVLMPQSKVIAIQAMRQYAAQEVVKATIYMKDEVLDCIRCRKEDLNKYHQLRTENEFLKKQVADMSAEMRAWIKPIADKSWDIENQKLKQRVKELEEELHNCRNAFYNQ